MSTNEEIVIKKAVRDRYAAAARDLNLAGREGTRQIAQAFGYAAEELNIIPEGANLGLSCGNPTAFAELAAGEVVVDLGCGGGLDVFLAARKVGPTGRVIGIDMTQDMIDRARRNAAQSGLDNLEFHRAEIERLPLPDASVDCVISNCVLNLVPDKPRAFAEIFRVLKPGGRLRASDIALKQALPADLAQNVAAYVGCVAGAISVAEYTSLLARAGFVDVMLADTGADLNAYALVEGQSGCCSPSAEAAPDRGVSVAPAACCGSSTSTTPAIHLELADLLRRHDVNAYALSAKVSARKPLR